MQKIEILMTGEEKKSPAMMMVVSGLTQKQHRINSIN